MSEGLGEEGLLEGEEGGGGVGLVGLKIADFGGK